MPSIVLGSKIHGVLFLFLTIALQLPVILELKSRLKCDVRLMVFEDFLNVMGCREGSNWDIVRNMDLIFGRLNFARDFL